MGKSGRPEVDGLEKSLWVSMGVADAVKLVLFVFYVVLCLLLFPLFGFAHRVADGTKKT